jgi:hypothetical protein
VWLKDSRSNKDEIVQTDSRFLGYDAVCTGSVWQEFAALRVLQQKVTNLNTEAASSSMTLLSVC